MDRYSFLNAMHSKQLSMLYEKYLSTPDIIEPSWRAFFQGFDFAQENYNKKDKKIDVSLKNFVFDKNVIQTISEKLSKEFKVINLINAYRTRGHLFTKTNPIQEGKKYEPNLNLYHFELLETDFDTIFDASKIIGIESTSLKNIIQHLKKIYCDSIGIEYMHIHELEKITWIQKWVEINDNRPKLSFKEKQKILFQLNQSIVFENFLHTKFVGQKRFSIEGNESLFPAVYEIIEYASNYYKTEEFIMGMTHRGRLNIFSNLFNKNCARIFSEFSSKEYEDTIFSGDVKYHLGATMIKKNDKTGKLIKIKLVPNPSHLETINSIVQGITRAKIDNYYSGNTTKILPLLIHGDAAVAGQGIVYEILQMSNLKGYTTGGTIHIVINNQIGFTTNYFDARSSMYCTDIAKILDSPIIHVNSDDIEAVIHTVRFAVDFRMRYHQDVFIDLVGYRKYGHNEGDEPRFTQPLLYKTIRNHPNTLNIYKKKLEKDGVITLKLFNEIDSKYKEYLNKNYEESKNINKSKLDAFIVNDEFNNFPIINEEKIFEKIDTTFSINRLRQINQIINTLPIGKIFYRKTKKLFEQRLKMVQENNIIDWSIAELLSYASLLDEGYHVRLSGEDVERGTFSHRHGLITSEDEEKYILLNHIHDKQGKMYIYNSLLSEYGVLGFDYGYAMTSPNTLTLWEAQFGDFSNGAQIIIDQYIASAEDKWKISNGLVILLPHGYEGQGAEHSSARIERYLQLCARYNIFVANCTTPSNFYHILRRQIKFSFRKPLIIFTPKSLLRHHRCISKLEELSKGSFQEIIDDIFADPIKINKLAFCSGKIYYELLERKEKIGDETTALIRIEQLYPLHKKSIQNIIKRYFNNKYLFWVQEEPENMGAWLYILRYFKELPWKLIAPEESATTAPGSNEYFLKIQTKIIESVFQL